MRSAIRSCILPAHHCQLRQRECCHASNSQREIQLNAETNLHCLQPAKASLCSKPSSAVTCAFLKTYLLQSWSAKRHDQDWSVAGKSWALFEKKNSGNEASLVDISIIFFFFSYFNTKRISIKSQLTTHLSQDFLTNNKVEVENKRVRASGTDVMPSKVLINGKPLHNPEPYVFLEFIKTYIFAATKSTKRM